MKCISTADPRRGDKRATDLLDLWRLLSDDPVATTRIIEELAGAPGSLPRFVGTRLRELFRVDPAGLVADMARGPGAVASASEAADLWSAVIGPQLKLER